MSWAEIGEKVLVRRYAELDLTVGLVLGGEACLVVDTRGDAVQGAELAAAVRRVTPLPWSVVLTHAHFDHAFGTTAFLPCPVWAHEGCHAELLGDGPRARERWAARYREQGRPEIARALAATEIALPDHLVTGTATLDLGGRDVRLAHLGPAHTDHDLVVHVPDAGVLFAGDLVEHAPGGSFTAESFGADTDLAGWPAALAGILALAPRHVVPGHGEPVGAEFVSAQLEPLGRLATLCASGLDTEEVVARSPYPRDVTLAALGTSR